MANAPKIFSGLDFMLPPGALRATLDIGPSLALSEIIAGIADEVYMRKKAFAKKVYLHQVTDADGKPTEFWSEKKPAVVTKIALLINEEMLAPKVTKKPEPAV
jgi:hypothetical protein